LELIAAGRAARERVLKLAPDSAPAYVEAARFGLVEATWAERTGQNPEAMLAQARADAEKAVALNPKLADAQLAAAEVCLQSAMAQPSRVVVDAGLAYVAQALALNPRFLKPKAIRAALLRLRSL
jgi:hypothetical protein